MKIQGFAVILAILAAGVFAAPPAAAIVDCGDPPMNRPVIPDGETASRQDMLTAVDAVQAFSDAVDEYLECKDERAQTVFQWMTEEQRDRWNEDTTEIHNRRVEIQRKMNEQIRVFNENNAEDAGAEGD